MRSYLLYRGGEDLERLRPLLERADIFHGTALPAKLDGVHTVIQWGARSTPDHVPEPVVWMNPQRALRRLENRFLMEKMLALHGIDARFGQSELPSLRSCQGYRVLVFHLKAIALHRGFASLDPAPRNRFYRLLLREAVKAVYLSGLDFGEVLVTVRHDRYVVAGIDPVPHLTAETGGRLAAALREYDQLFADASRSADVYADRLVMGADCEFLLCREDGKVISASRYLPKKGRVGCDGLRVRGRGLIYPLAEVRPRPNRDVRMMVGEIRRTMSLAIREIGRPELSWRAGGMPRPGFPLGGHLHFSGIPLHSRLLRVLDNYLALPLVMVETEEERKRRPRYGFPGDFRLKEHGGFEYRTLPSWLVSPRTALAVCALARFLVLHHDGLQARPLDRPEVQKHYYTGNKTGLLPVVEDLFGDLMRQDGFLPVLPDVQTLMRQIRDMQPWRSGEDIRRFWKIEPFAPFPSASGNML